MNPLELTQAAAEASGRTLADISPTHAELVDIAQTNKDIQSIKPPSVESIEQDAESQRVRAEAAEALRADARELLTKATKQAGAVTDKYRHQEATIAILKANTDEFTYAAAYMAARVLGDPYLSAHAFMDMQEVSPNPRLVISTQGEINWIDEAGGKLATMIRLAGITHDQAYIDKIIDDIQQVEATDTKASLLANLAQVTHDQGILSAALEALSRARADETSTDEAMLSASGWIAAELTSRGDYEQAQSVAMQLDRPYYQANVLMIIARVNPDPAILDEVTRLVESIEDDNEKAGILTEILSFRPTPDNIQKALVAMRSLEGMLKQIEAEGICRVLADGGDFVMAGSIMNGYCPGDSYEKASFYMTLAYVKHGYLVRARSEADQLTKPELKAKAYAAIAGGMLQRAATIEDGEVVGDSTQ